MVTLFSRLGSDERGFVVTSELVLIATLCVLGLVTGLTCLRQAVNAELGDVASAIGSLNQSYSYSGKHGCITPRCGVSAWTAGSAFFDGQDEQRATLEGGCTLQPGPVLETLPCPPATPDVPPCTTCPAEVNEVPCPCPPLSTSAASPLPCPCAPAVPPSNCTPQPAGSVIVCPGDPCVPSTCAPFQHHVPMNRPGALVW